MEEALNFPRAPGANYDDQMSKNNTLIKEMWKTESVIKIMNQCAEGCNMQFQESGLDNDRQDSVCFKNCLGKAYDTGINML